MTNREQIWRERLAILKDGLIAAVPGIVLFMIFAGIVIATGRIDRQWDEGVRSRRNSVNELAVGQLKDFAVIQENQSQIDYLPEGIDADRFTRDNEAFVAFVDEYFNWDSFDDMCALRLQAYEQIGEYTAVWNQVYFEVRRERETYFLLHQDTFDSMLVQQVGSLAPENPRAMWQTAMVQDIHAVEILNDGQYLYLAVLPAHRFVDTASKDFGYPNGIDQPLCGLVWYSCDENSVITPWRLSWVDVELELYANNK